MRIKVTAVAPGVTPLAKELRPTDFIINFSGSVARLEGLKRVKLQIDESRLVDAYPPITSGIRMDPPAEGDWRWGTESRLIFRPKHDWPAGQKYRVTLDRSLFPPHVALEAYSVEMTTPIFMATMPKLEFYTDPTDRAVKQVVATFEFTHRIDMVELEKHLSLAMIGGSVVFKKGAPRFTITAGLHQRVAYVRTSALTLPEREDFMRVTLGKGLPTLQGGAVTVGEVEKKVLVPDLYSFFRIKELKGMIVRNNEGEPEQIVLITTTGAAKSEDIQKALHVWLLPKKRAAKGADDDEEKEWGSPKEIDEDVLKRATLLPIKLVPSGKENSELHSFRIALETADKAFLGTTAARESFHWRPSPGTYRIVALDDRGRSSTSTVTLQSASAN